MAHDLPTPAVTALMAAYQSLNTSEKAELGRLIVRAEHERNTSTDSAFSHHLGSLRRVATRLGRTPTVSEYKLAARDLANEGTLVEPVHRVIAFFGSWRAAKEALDLAHTSTDRRVEARFRLRRLDKVWRYTEASLRDALTRCADHYGRPPMVVEYDWWRQRELELAHARGDHGYHLPSPTPFRRRYGTWERALLHFGYTLDQIHERLDPTSPKIGPTRL